MQAEIPTYYTTKSWQRIGRAVQKNSREPPSVTKSLDDLIQDGESYSKSSGVELKFDDEDLSEFDWDKSFTWAEPGEIVKRYAYLNRIVFIRVR